MTVKLQTPPSNARRIWRVADLPPERSSAQYEIRNEGCEPRIVTLQKRNRQVMDLLMASPIHCASPVRISDIVHILKRETRIVVETEMYPGDPTTGTGSFGVYFLKSRVTRLDDCEVAA